MRSDVRLCLLAPVYCIVVSCINSSPIHMSVLATIKYDWPNADICKYVNEKKKSLTRFCRGCRSVDKSTIVYNSYMLYCIYYLYNIYIIHVDWHGCVICMIFFFYHNILLLWLKNTVHRYTSYYRELSVRK